MVKGLLALQNLEVRSLNYSLFRVVKNTQNYDVVSNISHNQLRSPDDFWTTMVSSFLTCVRKFPDIAFQTV